MNTISRLAWDEIYGKDLEEAFAKAFKGVVVGGIRDGGKDVLTGDETVPYIQVKNSEKSLREFLGYMLRNGKNFIACVLGDPGERQEMLSSLNEFGVWVGHNIPDRLRIMRAVAEVRYLVTR